MAYIVLYNNSNNNEEVHVPVSIMEKYDLGVSSGSVTDSKGRNWSISSTGSVSSTKKIDFQSDAGVKLQTINDAYNTIASIFPSFKMYVRSNLANWRENYGYNDGVMTATEESGSPTKYVDIRLRSYGRNDYRMQLVGDVNNTGMNSYGYEFQDPFSPANVPTFGFMMSVYDAEDEETWSLGYVVIETYAGDSGYSKITVVYNDYFADYVEPNYDPGEEGFKPTGDYSGDIPGIGGRPKDGEKLPPYKTDEIEQPDTPDESTASAIGSGFLTAYDITQGNLEAVGACLFGERLEDKLHNLRARPMDYIVSLNVFPCKPTMGSSRSIKIGRWICTDQPSNVNPDALGFNANGFPLTKQFKQFDFGTLQVGENFGSFLDYTQTTIELFLPFIGSIDIDVAEVMNGSINVKYTVDFFTGMCVANVLCTKIVTLANGQSVSQYAQHSYQGNCAVQIPVGSVDYASMIGSLINGSIKTIGGFVTGNVSTAVDGLGNLITAKPQVTTKGSIGANAGYCSVMYPYIRVTRPIPVTPVSYQETEGYPSYIDSALGQCTGLCVCSSINLKGVSHATDSELQRIEQLCKEGVYI